MDEPIANETNAAAEVAPQRTGISLAWRALRHRNFRLFFGGQSISLIGTWMTRIATAWLVYRLTGSAWLLGIVGFCGQIPTFLLAPFAGVWVDRLNRRHVLVVTQTLAMVQSLVLAALTLTHVVTITEILWLSIFQGMINAFDMPGRQAFMVQMIEDRQDLGNAIALNSSMVNMARLVGPSLAGLVIAGFGEGYCFLIDGISYIAVIISLLLMQLPKFVAALQVVPMLEQLKEGWAYVSQFTPVRTILLLFAVVSLMGMPFTVLMPIFAAKVLHGGPHTLGFLDGCGWDGCADRCDFIGHAQVCAGAWARHRHLGRNLWGGVDCIWDESLAVAFVAADADHRIRHDAGHGRQQHDYPNHCSRG